MMWPANIPSSVGTRGGTSRRGTPPCAKQLCGWVFTLGEYYFNAQLQQCIMSSKEQRFIEPNSHFILLWSILFSLFIIAYFSCAVFQICFMSHSSQLLNTTLATITILLLCLLDTFITINTKIVIRGQLPLFRVQNVKNYLFSPLSLLDATIILILVVRIGMGANNQMKYALSLSILDLIVALKFYNLRRYQRTLKLYYFSDWSLLFFEFCKYLILLAFLCHIVGCIYFLIDALLIEAAWYPIQQHWLVNSSAMPNLYSAPIWQQYLYSFYFSIVTLSTVAYGDITPLNPTETSFVICILAFLLAFYAYIFGQIYQIVNWFNRKQIKTQQNKHRLANFLKKLHISKQLSDKIISQYQFREKKTSNINKNLFINDIPHKLMESYQSTSFTFDKKIFMPNFISKLNLKAQKFNELLSQKFILPDEEFGPIYFTNKNDYQDRTIYYIQNQVRRSLRTGTSKITQNAEINKWLGINAFLASYHDQNQKWKVQTPTQFITLRFKKLKYFLHYNFALAEQKLIQQCHRASLSQGSYQQMNRCLLCWQSYHCSLFCTQYRHYSQIKLSKFERKDSKLTMINKKIYLKFVERKFIKRLYKTHIKVIRRTNLIMPHCQIGVQTQFAQLQQSCEIKYKNRNSLKSKEESVYEWENYMAQFNISKHDNLIGTKQFQLMKKILNK